MAKNLNSLIKDNLLFKDPTKLREVVYYDLETIIKEIYKTNKEYIEKNINNILNIYPNLETFNTWFISFLINNNYNPRILLSYINNNPHIQVSSYYLSILILSNKYLKISEVSKYISLVTNTNPHLLTTKKQFKKEHIDTLVIDKVINENIDIIAKELLTNNKNISDTYQYLSFIKELIKELIQEEKVKLSDIIPLTKGSSCYPYKIGDKVLKIGTQRKTFYISDNSRFLKPLYRKDLELPDNNKLYIEITEYVDTSNITKEDVFKIYQELRDENLFWLDPKPENLGRLLKDNKVYFNDIQKVDINSTSYKTQTNTILPAGELVLLDNEYIYTESEIIKLNLLSVIKNNKYERKYQEQKKNKVTK